MMCGAKARQSGQPCRVPAMKNGRCHKHGGSTPTGIAASRFVTGRYSKYLPSRLAGRYEEAAGDTELLALRDDISLLDTRIGQVVAALETGESRETWAVLASSWTTLEAQFQTLLDTGETPEDMESTIGGIAKLMRDGLSEGYVWAEIRGLLKERVSLVSAEQKRLVEMQQFVTAEQAMTLVSAVMASVRRHVSDRTALAGISADLAGLVVRDGGELGAAGSAV